MPIVLLDWFQVAYTTDSANAINHLDSLRSPCRSPPFKLKLPRPVSAGRTLTCEYPKNASSVGSSWPLQVEVKTPRKSIATKIIRNFMPAPDSAFRNNRPNRCECVQKC